MIILMREVPRAEQAERQAHGAIVLAGAVEPRAGTVFLVWGVRQFTELQSPAITEEDMVLAGAALPADVTEMAVSQADMEPLVL